MNVMVGFSFYVGINIVLSPHVLVRCSQVLLYYYCDSVIKGCLKVIDFFLEGFNFLYIYNLRPDIVHTLALIKFWNYLRVVWLERGQD